MESREYYENVRVQAEKHLTAFDRELGELNARIAEINRQSEWLREESAKALNALCEIGPANERTAYEIMDSVTVKLWDRYVESGYTLTEDERGDLALAYYLVADLRDMVREEAGL